MSQGDSVPTPNYNRWVFWSVLCGFLLLALLKIWPLLLGFSTVEVKGLDRLKGDEAGSKMDQVLLQHLSYLGSSNVFHNALSRGQRTTEIKQPLWMDRCEVKQGEFYKFSQWQPFYPNRVPKATGQPSDWKFHSETEGHTISGRLNVSTNGVTWFDAYAYCGAAGGRMPTLEEWIAAAAGHEQRLYPWGDDFDPRAWPYLDPLLNAAQQCGLHPETDTPEGIADMGHSVSEWVGTKVPQQFGLVAGGNAYSAPRELHSLTNLYRTAPKTFRSPYIGFRCAYDNHPDDQTGWRTPLQVVRIKPGVYPVGMPEGSRLPELISVIPSGKLHLIKQIFQNNKSQQRGGSGGSDSSQDTPSRLFVTQGEITRREYAAFLRDPFVKMGLYSEISEPEQHDYIPPDWDEQRYELDLPVVNVDWWSAYAFAAWVGGQLLTAEQWSSIASDQGRNLYPWGEKVGDADVISGERRTGGPVSFSSDRGDVTAGGVFDMGGNVSEWTRSVASADGVYALVIKGGNYLLPAAQTARFDYENRVPPHHRSKTLGFRVVFERAR